MTRRLLGNRSLGVLPGWLAIIVTAASTVTRRATVSTMSPMAEEVHRHKCANE